MFKVCSDRTLREFSFAVLTHQHRLVFTSVDPLICIDFTVHAYSCKSVPLKRQHSMYFIYTDPAASSLGTASLHKT